MINVNCRSIFLKILLILFAFAGFFLNAQLSYDSSFSKTEADTWLTFEPDEEFSLDGSKSFLKDASTLKFYETVSGFFSFYDNSKNSLGLKLSWDRLGHHYADIIPKKIQEDPFAYPIDTLDSMSIWIWSPGYQHELAAIFEREDGYVYSLKLAKLNFRGWRKFKVKVPLTIKTKINTVGFNIGGINKKFFFSRFRVYTSPKDKVGDVYLFLDNFDVVQELYTRLYDGIGVEEVIRNEIKSKKEGQETSDGGDSQDSTQSENSQGVTDQ